MSIIADIAALEQRIADLLVRLSGDLDPTRRRFTDGAAEAVLAALDDFSIEDLRALDLAQLVETALEGAVADLEREIGRAIGERVQQIISDTAAFYQERAVDTSGVREAVQRSETAQQLAGFLERGMSLTRTSLQDATVDLVQDAIASGKINRNDLRDAIAARAESSAHHATTQAGTSIAGYNQAYRNTLAERAGLDHFLYYGSLVANSRPFCRACAGKVFTSVQIDEMDSGMLQPVKVFRGGWNCTHSFLPVSVDWDEELEDAMVSSEAETKTEGGITFFE